MTRLLQKTIKRIQTLYAKGNITLGEIAERTEVSYSAVYNHTRILERGFNSPSEYKEYLAKKKGFASEREYKEDLAHRKGFASYTELKKHQSGFASYKDYIEYLAKKRGFKSYGEYRRYLAEQRQKRPENKIFGASVRKRLKEKGKNLAWLAWKMHVTDGTTSSYARGISIPRGKNFKRACFVLDLPYKTIDDLVA